jgi:hypothetical protein
MSEQKAVSEMIGEAMREVGVLVLVFGLPNQFVHDSALTLLWTVAVLAVGLVSEGVAA